MDYIIYREGELYHHGVKGMHWGVRRYQNEDGTLTREGIKQLRQDKKSQYVAEGRRNAGGKAKIASELASSFNKQYLKAEKKQQKIEDKIKEAKIVNDSKKITKLGRKWINSQRSVRSAEYATKHLDELTESTYSARAISTGTAFVGSVLFGVPLGMALSNLATSIVLRTDPEIQKADEYAISRARSDYDKWSRQH